jgi:hypothetical protein
MAVIGWSADGALSVAQAGAPKPTTMAAEASTVSSLRMHYLLDPWPQARVLADKEAFVSALLLPQCR